MSAMSVKPSKTEADLKVVLDKALRAHPECEGIFVKSFKKLEASDGIANWDAEFASDGRSITTERRRILLSVKHGIQKHFNLIADPT